MPNTLLKNEVLFRALETAIADLAEQGRRDSFYDSLMASWQRYGSLTERQEAALERSLANFATRQAERRAQAKAVTSPIPSGRVVITGTVQSTKWVDSQYGGALKMRVQSDFGWAVWGTVPASLTGNNLKGARVTFTASVEPKDEAFGFFSRPTSASLVDAPAAQPEALEPAPEAVPQPANDFKALLAKDHSERREAWELQQPVRRPFLANLVAQADLRERAAAGDPTAIAIFEN